MNEKKFSVSGMTCDGCVQSIKTKLELEDDIFINDESSQENSWFDEDKLESIKKIHSYLEKRPEIGKVQSIYSLIQVAEKINKADLDSFSLNVIYKKIPVEYKKRLIPPRFFLKS